MALNDKLQEFSTNLTFENPLKNPTIYFINLQTQQTPYPSAQDPDAVPDNS